MRVRLTLVAVSLLVGGQAFAVIRVLQRYPPVKFGDPLHTAVASNAIDYPTPFLLFPRANIMAGLLSGRPWNAPIAAPIAMLAEPLASFAAITGGLNPPDVAGAAGPNHLMTTHNGAFQVQDRKGAVLATMTDAAFWSATGGRLFWDPRVIYDSQNARWTIVEQNFESGRAGILLAVSQTGDPTGWWDIYLWPAAPNEWYDFPQLGSNDTTIVLSTMALSRDFSTAPRREIFLFDKSSFYAGNTSVPVVFGPDLSSLTPVTALDAGVTANYLLDAFSAGVKLYHATNESVTLVETINSPAPCASYGVNAPQLGTTQMIFTGGLQISNAVLRNGSLWFVQTCFLPAKTPTHSAIQWWKTTTSGEVLDFGRIDDGEGGQLYAFPSMAVNRQNDVVIGFTQFSSAAYASAAYASRSGSDPAGTFRGPVILKGGDGPFGKERWGDYTTTIVDLDDVTFWTLQEYAALPLGTSGRWGTWWSHLPAVPEASRRRPARH